MSEIPRRIIQTARSRDLNPLAKAAAMNLKLLHPSWEYRFFDDAAILEFVAAEFPQHLGIFRAFPRSIQRVDFFRYLAVFRLGGFYFDLDVFLSERLDDLVAKDCVFPFEELTLNRFLREQHGDWEIGNYGFGAKPGDPFLAQVIENCVRAQRDPSWVDPMMGDLPSFVRGEFHVLNTTGPGLITRTLFENPALAANVTVLFPRDVRDERSWHQFGDYGVHAMDGSWRTKGSFVRRRLALWWEMRTRKGQRPASHSLGPNRSVAGITSRAKPQNESVVPRSEFSSNR